LASCSANHCSSINSAAGVSVLVAAELVGPAVVEVLLLVVVVVVVGVGVVVVLVVVTGAAAACPLVALLVSAAGDVSRPIVVMTTPRVLGRWAWLSVVGISQVDVVYVKGPVTPQSQAASEPASDDEKQQLQQQSGPEPEPEPEPAEDNQHNVITHSTTVNRPTTIMYTVHNSHCWSKSREHSTHNYSNTLSHPTYSVAARGR